MQEVKSVWGKHEASSEKVYHLKGGEKEILFKYVSNSWLVKIVERENIDSENVTVKNNDDANFLGADIYQTGKSNIYVSPALPAKPLVFRNNSKIGINPDQRLQLYLKVPVSAQFYSKQIKHENLIFECTLQRLSDTWFGEVDSGEPAFSIGSYFTFKPEDIKTSYFEAICPINIHNNSSQILDIQRLIIHVEYMNLYNKKGQLYTDTAFIEYKGVDLVGNVEFAPDRKLIGDSNLKIAPPRQVVGKSILGKSFHFIKKLT